MRALLGLSIMLLAGCSTGGGHDAHGPMEVVLGVKNVGTIPAAFELRIEGPVGSGPMGETVGVQANASVERRWELSNEGSHRAVVEWSRGMVADSWTTDDCRSYHVVFLIDPARTAEVVPERTRECH